MDSDLDFEDLGFRCGIEIHQQLDTSDKLFCGCSTGRASEGADSGIERELRPVPSEMGEMDRAAQYEFLKGRRFRYNIYRGLSCLVEMDEEPPHPVNRDALETALVFSLLTDCRIPDEIHFMRKTVIDGSNTAGFQRTAIVGLDGGIETSEGKVGIEDVELEEESAGIHSKGRDEGIFDLDRLGIPLIEVGTDASIKNPAHAQEVAERIGMLLRSTLRVKRGLGTIRQDVNVSIEDGARIEIKGFQEIENLDRLVEEEVRRQKNLVELMEELQEEVSPGFEDVTDIFEESENEIVKEFAEKGGEVAGFRLKGLEGKMNRELCTELTLGKELANYARAHGVNGIIHTDEDLSRYGLEEEFERLEEVLERGEGDVLVIIAGERESVERAAEAVVERANLLPEEVPEETRTVGKFVTTRYARPLPGKARMYPETDIPPVVVSEGFRESMEEQVPETLEEREERYEEMVGSELASQVISSGFVALFDRMVEDDVDPKTTANVLTNVLGDLESREGVEVEDIGEGRIERLVELHSKGDIGTSGVRRALLEAAKSPGKDVEDILSGLETAGEEEIREVVKEVVEEKKDLIEEQGEHAKGALMGLVMERLENADGSLVSKVLEEELEGRT